MLQANIGSQLCCTTAKVRASSSHWNWSWAKCTKAMLGLACALFIRVSLTMTWALFSPRSSGCCFLRQVASAKQNNATLLCCFYCVKVSVGNQGNLCLQATHYTGMWQFGMTKDAAQHCKQAADQMNMTPKDWVFQYTIQL